MSKIKICGLKRPEDIETVNLYQPEYVGFVFAGTKRRISDETAAVLKSALDPSIKAVGVFVDEPVAHVVKLVRQHTIDLIQLHGEEDIDYVNQLKEKLRSSLGASFQVPIIKAVRIDAGLEVTDEQEAEILEENQKLIDAAKALQVDYLLFDAKVKGSPGGSGQAFDIAGLPSDEKIGIPYFLAGGIGLHNVSQLIQLRHPFAIDVSSSVETDGYKDRNKIKLMIEAVRKESK